MKRNYSIYHDSKSALEKIMSNQEKTKKFSKIYKIKLDNYTYYAADVEMIKYGINREKIKE